MEVDPVQSSIVAEARQWIVNRIRDIRVARGMTQRELSNKMEVHESRVGDLEQNRSDYKISTVLRASWGLGVSPEELLKGCPGWKRKAAKGKQMVVIESGELQNLLVSLGVSQQKSKDAVDQLLSSQR